MIQQHKSTLDKRTQVIADHPTGKLNRWYQQFRIEWADCQRCPLHKHRNKVVQFRGIIPAPILFVGEAPWVSEDEVGRPFVGPAGRLLDEMIEAAGIEDGQYCLINVIGCIPRDVLEDGTLSGKPRRPSSTEIKACSPRFGEMIQRVNPKLLILLGNVAHRSLDAWTDGQPAIELVHPSFILQKNRSPLLIKRFVLTLRQAVEGLHAKTAQ